MKKFLSLLITVCMIFGMCTMSVLATEDGTTETTTKKNLVGSYKGAGVEGASVKDGVSDFTSPATHDVPINFQIGTNALESRYAVDITYSDVVLQLNDTKFVWNVNTHQYEAQTTSSDSGSTGAVNTAAPITADTNIIITNHSDNPVYFGITLTNSPFETVTNYLTVSATAKIDNNSTAEAVNGDSIASNIEVGSAATDNKEVEKTATIEVKATLKTKGDNTTSYTWNDFVTANSATESGEISLGNLTITVSKDSSNTPTTP